MGPSPLGHAYMQAQHDHHLAAADARRRVRAHRAPRDETDAAAARRAPAQGLFAQALRVLRLRPAT